MLELQPKIVHQVLAPELMRTCHALAHIDLVVAAAHVA